VTDWIVAMLVAEGIALAAFVYYLDHTRRMALLEKGVVEEDSPDLRLERRLLSGLFLLLAGAALIISPSLGRAAGLEVDLAFHLLFLGFVAFSGGLAMILGWWSLKRELARSSK
jgi:hypothetical protein